MKGEMPVRVRVGWGLVMGVVFLPMLGPVAIAIGVGLGVVFGAALEEIARHRR